MIKALVCAEAFFIESSRIPSRETKVEQERKVKEDRWACDLKVKKALNHKPTNKYKKGKLIAFHPL